MDPFENSCLDEATETVLITLQKNVTKSCNANKKLRVIALLIFLRLNLQCFTEHEAVREPENVKRIDIYLQPPPSPPFFFLHSHLCSGKNCLCSQNSQLPPGWLFIVAWWRMKCLMCAWPDPPLETSLPGSPATLDVVATETAPCWHHRASSDLPWRPKSHGLIASWPPAEVCEKLSTSNCGFVDTSWNMRETDKQRKKKEENHTHACVLERTSWRALKHVFLSACLMATTAWDELRSVINILQVCKHAVWKCMIARGIFFFFFYIAPFITNSPVLFAGINRNNAEAHLIAEGVMSAIVSNVCDCAKSIIMRHLEYLSP